MESEARSSVRVRLYGDLRSDLHRRLPPELKVDFVPFTALLAPPLPGEAEPERDVDLVDATAIPTPRRGSALERALAGRASPKPRAIVVVPSADDAAARFAACGGAWDVLRADTSAEEVLERLECAARLHRLEQCAAASPPAPRSPRTDSTPSDAEAPSDCFPGRSEAARRVRTLVRRVAASDVPVLVCGESGTGKELVARSIHELGPRTEAPLVPIHCAAIPEALLEAELFGYERGAFTGATQSRRGRLEMADGGTIFLDEIGELSGTLQVKLLRFLEDHVVERLGGERSLRLDVRVVAATNRDLQAAVDAGHFREDLYYRLNVLALLIPPLRSREGDPVHLAEQLLAREARAIGRPPPELTPEARTAIARAPWPGNVRQLLNHVRRALVLAEGRHVTAGDFGLVAPEEAAPEPPLALREARARAEAECLRTALERAGGNKSRAARLLAISRTQLYELMERYAVRSG